MMTEQKSEMFADVINGKFCMTWSNVLDQVRENPEVSHKEMLDEDLFFNESGESWSIKEIADILGIEIRVIDDEKVI